jgi:hypothetical protein
VHEQLIALEHSGAVEDLDDLKPSIRKDARELVNGEAAPFLDALNSGGSLGEVRREIRVIDEALGLIEPIEMRLRANWRDARVAATADQYRAIMRAAALAVIELEHALQARDDLTKLVKPGYPPLPGDGWPLAGRLDGTSQARRFLEAAVRHGWITAAEFAKELEQVRRRRIA